MANLERGNCVAVLIEFFFYKGLNVIACALVSMFVLIDEICHQNGIIFFVFQASAI